VFYHSNAETLTSARDFFACVKLRVVFSESNEAMPYRVVLIFKNGDRASAEIRFSQERTPDIGMMIEVPYEKRIVRAQVRGIVRARATLPNTPAGDNLVIAREI